MAATSLPSDASLNALLREVSRSFYLTMRVLPAAVRPQISLAYLLARATDTLADTDLVPVEQRLEALATLRQRMLGESSARLEVSAFTAGQGGGTLPASAAERVLLGRLEEALALLGTFATEDRALIRRVLDTITGGQELDLRRFELDRPAGGRGVIALRTQAELDDYTYRVAGCVGEFWTLICRANLFPDARLDDAWLLEHGIRFGKGLQLVNILRDLPEDLRRGRCYLPGEELDTLGLRPEDLMRSAVFTSVRPLYERELELARAHLAAGWAYTQALPRSQLRVRLACAWPVLIGVRTLALLRAANPLDASRRVKVTRPEVRRIILGTMIRSPWPASWNALYRRLAG